MGTTKFSIHAALKAPAALLNNFFTTAFKSIKQATNIIKPSKRSKLKWVALCLYAYISYNSCNIRHAQLLSPSLKKESVASSMDSMARTLKAMETANQKTIYFTFDDGPNCGTANVMDILIKQKIPATFFLVGSHIYGSDRQMAIFQDLLCQPSFEAANHSFYHAKNRYSQYYKSPQLVLADFQLMRDSAKLNNKLARTPGRDVWRTSNISFDINKYSVPAANLLKAHDYTLIGWDVEWKADSKKQLKKTPEALAIEIDQYFKEHLTQTENHLVVLMHDQHFTDSSNVRALEDLIEQLKQKGEYAFRRVGEYPYL